MRRYVMSDAADDLMWETDADIRNIRKDIQKMRELSPEDGDHRYFPLSIQVEAPRSPYFRKLRVIEVHHLDGTVTTYSSTYPEYVRENGEAPQ
jgi:hypothetical protein